MAQRSMRQGNRQGVALLTALGLLLIFTALGTAYLRFATLRAEESRHVVAQTRSKEAAAAGIRAVIGAIEAAAAEKTLGELPEQMAFTFPLYAIAEAGVIEDGRYRASVTVQIEEESSKLNINHAPSSVLQQVLDIDGETARTLRADLPAAGGERWFLAVEDLVAHDALSESKRREINADLLTVSTVSNPADPRAFLNINTVHPALLGAVLDVPRDQAEEIAEARPFRSLAELADVAEKNPSTFNYRPDPETPDRLPRELVLQPTAFRLTATAVLEWDDGRETDRRQVESVVALEDRSVAVFTYWSEAYS